MGGRPGVTSWLAEPAPGAAAGSSHLASVVKASAPSWHWFSVVPGQGEPHHRTQTHSDSVRTFLANEVSCCVCRLPGQPAGVVGAGHQASVPVSEGLLQPAVL